MSVERYMSDHKGADGITVPGVASMKSTRRGFLAALAALPFVRKFQTGAPSPRLQFGGPLSSKANAVAWKENGHTFYALNFHPDCFVLEWPRISDDA